MQDEDKTREQLIEELGQLRRDGEIYRKMIECGSDAVFLIDPSGNILSFNNAFLENFGFREDADARGRSASILYPSQESYSAFFAKFKRSVSGGTFRTQWGLARQDGTVFPADVRIFGAKAPGAGKGSSSYSVLVRDLTREKEEERQAALTAMHDQLTGLPNRVLLNDRIYRATLQGERSGRPFAVISIRLDRVKLINETFGYMAGDNLLKEAALRLRKAVDKSDTIARMAGTEFVLLLPEAGGRDDAVRIASNILSSFEEPFTLEEREIRVKLRIGIALFPEDGGTGQNLLRRASLAMHSAPEAGYQGYSPGMDQ